jgi:hypothetical protein
MRRGNLGVFGADVGGIGLAPSGESSDDATPTARLASLTCTTGPPCSSGRSSRGMDTARGGAADQQRHLHALPLHSPARKLISSSEGVIRPDSPMMSAPSALAVSMILWRAP